MFGGGFVPSVGEPAEVQGDYVLSLVPEHMRIKAALDLAHLARSSRATSQVSSPAVSPGRGAMNEMRRELQETGEHGNTVGSLNTTNLSIGFDQL